MKGVEIIPFPSERACEVLEQSIRHGYRQARRRGGWLSSTPTSKPHIRLKLDSIDKAA